jgi:hypothetical protein
VEARVVAVVEREAMARVAPAEPVAAHRPYRADIDGVRGLSVLLVVAFHAFPGLVPGGFVGVDVFFVISGFLITQIFVDDLRAGSFSVRGFYARRVRRIFPALAVVLSACLAFGWFALLGDEYASLGKHVAGGAGFVSNLVLLNETGYFDTLSHLKPLLHLECARRPVEAAHVLPEQACTVAVGEVVARQAEYRGLASKVLRRFPRVRQFDPAEFLCDAAYCRATRQGRVLYRDDDHLNGNGATLIAVRLLGTESASVAGRVVFQR